jgi:hypothetical protein
MEDRIRNLCAELVATSDSEQQLAIVTKLRGELRRHIEQLRLRLAEYPLEQKRHNGIQVVPSEIQGPAAVNSDSIRIVVIKGGLNESAKTGPEGKSRSDSATSLGDSSLPRSTE